MARPAAGVPAAGAARRAPLPRVRVGPRGALALSLCFAVALSLLLLALRARLSTANVALLYLLPVLTGATLGGLAPGVVASVVCVLAFDLLFIPPYGTLSVASGQDLLTLVLYLGVAAAAADLSARVRARAEEAARRAAANALLYDLSTALLAGDLQEILQALVDRLAQTFGLLSCAILLPDAQGTLEERAVHGTMEGAEYVEGARRIAASAAWAYRQGEVLALALHRPARFSDRVRRPAGLMAAPARGSPERSSVPLSRADPGAGLPGAALLFLPLRSGAGGAPHAVGLLRLVRPPGQPLSEEETRLLSVFGTQAALAVERAQLAAASAEAAVLRESDRAKSALLSNVSHELRTPLTTIRGAAESLLQADLPLESPVRAELLASVRDEAERLGILVANLLDLSRLEAGALRPDRHLYDPSEIVGGVLARLAPRLAGHRLEVSLDPDAGPALLDYALLDQLVANLLDNAAKYAPPGTAITVELRQAGTDLLLRVTDEGPGIPAEARERVFERFYRLPRSAEDRTPGSGLGLAIGKAIVEAHGGRIWVEPDRDVGAALSVLLPRAMPAAGETTP